LPLFARNLLVVSPTNALATFEWRVASLWVAHRHAPRTVDAIVSLDGDRPRRLRKAVELAAEGVAATLVVVRAEAVAPELLTAGSLPFDVSSVTPEPSTTRGEARAVARLVEECCWRRVVVVTSSYHVPRARLIFRRCLACEITVVPAGCHKRRLPLDISWEIAKFILAYTLRRSP
jgi:uncharacterized SAM-binding protein YcdF (DUF218 family)